MMSVSMYAVLLLVAMTTDSSMGERTGNAPVLASGCVNLADLCLESPACRAKYVVAESGGQRRRETLAGTLCAVLRSHGVTATTIEFLGDGDGETTARLLTDLHPVCLDPRTTIDEASSVYNVGAAVATLVVVSGAYVALFVVWNFRKK